MSKIRPIHAQGIFAVCKDGEIAQIINFDYEDKSLYYARLADKEKLDYELERIGENMQEFLDEERVLINDTRTFPRVYGVDLNFRGELIYPTVTIIIKFHGNLRMGHNQYLNIYKETKAEYNYEIYWIFPINTRITKVRVNGDYDIKGNILYIWVEKDKKIYGREEIYFKLQ